jgi:quinol-cytochrome oxidoreductase complex cytochrome b subunit
VVLNKAKSLIINFIQHLHPIRVSESSARLTYTFGLGGFVFFTFIITSITGILLVFKYSPTPDSANISMQYISTVYQYGWYIRNLHYWTAQVMVIAAVMHMIRIVLTGGYLRGRAFNWIIGNILLVFIFFLDLTGYFLRWDVKSNYALVTGMNLILEIPFAGKFLSSLIVGGADITENTLLHLYALHIACLPSFFFYSWYIIFIVFAGMEAYHLKIQVSKKKQ